MLRSRLVAEGWGAEFEEVSRLGGTRQLLAAGTHRRGSIPPGANNIEPKCQPLAMPSTDEAHRSVVNLCLEVEQSISMRPDFVRYTKTDTRHTSILLVRYIKSILWRSFGAQRSGIATLRPMIFAEISISIMPIIGCCWGFSIHFRL